VEHVESHEVDSALYDCLIHYFDESPMGYPEPDEMASKNRLLFAMQQGGVIVAERDGKIVGAACVEFAPFDWNPKSLILVERFFYVRPEYRAGGTGKALLSALKAIADHNKAFLSLDCFWGTAPEALDAFMRQNGFEHTGGLFIYRPKVSHV
jgi:L-amino acid N-acyltransferase YncA